MGTHVCKLRKEKLMEYGLLIFGTFVLITLLIVCITNKQRLSDLQIKFNLFEGFEFNCKFKK